MVFKAVLSLPLAPVPLFGVPTASCILLTRSPKLPRVCFNSFSFFLHLKDHKKRKKDVFKYIYICIQVHVSQWAKNDFYSKILSLSFSCKCPWSVSQCVTHISFSVTTIKYALVRGRNCLFLSQLYKALATFTYSVKLKTAQCFGSIVLIKSYYVCLICL